jgi:hypothetical protein
MNSVTAANSGISHHIQNPLLDSKPGEQSGGQVARVESAQEEFVARRTDPEQGEALSKVGILHRALKAALDTNNSLARLFEPIA